jgi:hypothetical protein
LWKNRNKLVPSGGTPEETTTHTAMLNHVIDSLIDAAIPEYDSRVARDDYYYPTSVYTTGPQDHSCFLQLLDLMVLTRRTHHSSRLFALVTQPKDDLLLEYQKFIIPLVPKLHHRYKQYSLDALLRAFVERWFQDLLGTPSNLPDAVVKKLSCSCKDCAGVNSFLRSDAAVETLWAGQQRRSHVQEKIKSSIPKAVTCITIARGSPHGLQITKTQAEFTMYKWNRRVANARAFLSLFGTPKKLARIMGDRYQDVNAALAGTKPYKIHKPVPVVPPVKNAPVASTSGVRAGPSGTRTAPVLAGTKRKAGDDNGDVIDLTSG